MQLENKETFTLSIKHKGIHQLVGVSATFSSDAGLPVTDYSIKIKREIFIIRPDSPDGVPIVWKLVSGNAHKQLIQLVGEAIERQFS